MHVTVHYVAKGHSLGCSKDIYNQIIPWTYSKSTVQSICNVQSGISRSGHCVGKNQQFTLLHNYVNIEQSKCFYITIIQITNINC